MSAVVLYGALYWLVMPLRLHDKPIFFDYSNRATTVRVFFFVAVQNVSSLRPSPWKNLSGGTAGVLDTSALPRPPAQATTVQNLFMFWGRVVYLGVHIYAF